MLAPSTHELPDYDEPAFHAVHRLILAGQADVALARLAEHTPRTHDQRFEHESHLGWALQIQGDYRAAVDHMLRALRLGSRRRELRVRARHQLSWTLVRMGDFAKAERQIGRAMAEIALTGAGREYAPGLMNTLASIHRRRGALSRAIETWERALLLPFAATESHARGVGVANLALAYLRRGNVDHARRLFEELAPTVDQSVPAGYQAFVHLARARLALHERRLEDCAAELAAAAQARTGSDYQTGIRHQVLTAELEIALGRPARARALLEDVLPDVLRKATLNDSAADAARVLATALFELKRYDEALEKARLAAGLGRHADVGEWAAGLRVAGQCLAALGRRDEALAALEEARTVLRGTDLMLERDRLEEVRRAQGFGRGATVALVAADDVEADADAGPSNTGADPSAAATARGGARSAHKRWRAYSQLRLRDGRDFLTFDVGLVARIHRAAHDKLPVLLVGETGTGKELVAHLVHELGDRALGPLVVVDCPTLTESLAEAELFGAVRGAYTGAINDRLGLVANADGGTLFLDELPEMPPAMQAKLLRLLQDGTYRRVGDTQVRRINARVVAATNRDPDALVAGGALKPDLMFRLDGHRLALEPLRAHPREIATLATELARSAGLAGITEAAKSRLAKHPWPGNVRQLEMLLRVAAAGLGRGATLDETDLDPLPEIEGDEPERTGAGLRAQRLEAERRTLQRILATHRGNVTAAARSLSMSRQGFYKALRRTGLI
jgi:transcriptional regulator of acetoin/glycerol metabolism